MSDTSRNGAAARRSSKYEPAPSDDADRRYAMAGRVARRGLPLILLALAVAAVLLFWRRVESGPGHEAAPSPQEPIPVGVVTVQPRTIPMRPRFLGRTEASQVVEIRARVAGYLVERTFKEGDRVEKGARLFQIDPRPFEAELEHARGRLASAEATLEAAEFQLRRLEALRAQEIASPVEFEEWRAQARVAAANVRQQRAADRRGPSRCAEYRRRRA